MPTKITPRSSIRVFAAVTGALVACALAVPAFAQVVVGERAPRAGAPSDWSHRRVVHANPDTRDEAARKGNHALEQWNRHREDPRFQAALARKRAALAEKRGEPPAWARGWGHRKHHPAPDDSGVHRDWSYIMGFTAGAGAGGLYPAKYSFDINAAPDCTNDFVAYTTNAAGVAFVAGTAGNKSGTFASNPAAGGTATITGSGGRSLVLTASATLNTGLNFLIGANTTITAANLAAAINRFGSQVGVTASTPGASSTVRVDAIGPGASGISVTEGLGNFTWTGGNGALAGAMGTAGQATILAFNGLYSSCGATYPLVRWSYNTGTGAVANTSPVLSLDGTQVAFTQVSGGVASLVVLKWAASSGGIVTPTLLANNGSYPACAAPCMRVIALNGSPNNSFSSPFYDYTNDVLYVGDNAGRLHKFTGVFNGTPAEVVTAGVWPATVSTGNLLTSPVYDSVTNRVFVGSDTGAATGGQLHAVDATTGQPSLASSAPLAAYTITSGGANTTGVRDSPIVDSSNGQVYVFVESDRNLACGIVGNLAECKAVYQFPTNFANTATWAARAELGRGQIAARVLYAGAFDEAYYNTGSGYLYVCGTTAGTTASTQPTLWRIPITSGVMGTTPVVGPTLVSATGVTYCSSVSQIRNGTNEYIYVSVNASGNRTGCTGACVYVFNVAGVTDVAWPSLNAAAGLTALGGTGGIIVDNISAVAGASQIYYSTITVPGNAIQAGQSGLQ